MTEKPKTYKAWILNDPNQLPDEECHFRPADKFPIPRSAIITENGDVKPIITYQPDNDELPDVKGMIRRRRFGQFRQLSRGWKYLTPSYLYKNQSTVKKAKFAETPKEFLNSVGDGKLWDDPDGMGPYEFGNRLALHPLKRLRTKDKRLESIVKLERTARLMFFAVIGAIIMVIILQS